MTAKNKAALKADNVATFADAKPGGILAAEERVYNENEIDSFINNQEVGLQTLNGPINLGDNTLQGVSNNEVTILTVLDEQSNAASQVPIGEDAPMQIEFGPGIVTPDITLSAAGALTVNVTGYYFARILLTMARSGGGGNSQLLTYAALGGTPIGNSNYARIDDNDSAYVREFNIQGLLTMGQIYTFHLVRDSSGTNSGQLEGFTPTLGTVPSATSARILIQKHRILV